MVPRDRSGGPRRGGLISLAYAMTLLTEITAKCSPELIASREHGEIARIVSIGRTKPSTREIGNGKILETVGLVHGNNMLDVLYSAPDFRHVRPLLEQGRLIAGSPLVVAAIQGMVPAVIPQPVADLLLAITVEPAPVSPAEVAAAMTGGL